MTASKEDIRGWFKDGVSQGKSYMIVACDTYDWGNYPVYCSLSDYAEKHASHNGKNMQKVDEVYSLKQPMEEQLALQRCFRGPADDLVREAEDMGLYDE